MGIWRLFVQDVPIRAFLKLHSLNFHIGGNLHGKILRHHPPNHLQADIDIFQAKGTFFMSLDNYCRIFTVRGSEMGLGVKINYRFSTLFNGVKKNERNDQSFNYREYVLVYIISSNCDDFFTWSFIIKIYIKKEGRVNILRYWNHIWNTFTKIYIYSMSVEKIPWIKIKNWKSFRSLEIAKI